jgi:hypothetical protein
MDTRTDSNIDQLAKEVHFVTAPFRFVWNLIIVSALLFLSPLIFAAAVLGLIFSKHPLTADDIWFLKIILGVFGPFAFCVWFAIITRWREVRRTGTHDGVVWANLRGFIALVLSFAGVFASLPFCYYHNIEGQASLLVMALGVMSPALLFFVLGLLRDLIGARE